MKGVVGKVALGQADAGFVYVTDVKPVAADVTGIAIPALGAAAGALRDRGGRVVVPQGRGAGVDRSACRAKPGGRARSRRLRPAVSRLVPGGGRRSRRRRHLPLPAAADRRDLHAGPARRPGPALGSGQAVDALVVTVETNLIALALILLIGTPTAWLIATRRVPRPRPRDHAGRAAARAAAGGRRDRAARGVRPRRAARRHARRARRRHPVHEGRGRARGRVRRSPFYVRRRSPRSRRSTRR